MNSWKTAFRSFYYEDMIEPPPIALPPRDTVLLVIDIQACYLPDEKPADECEHEWSRWQPFRARMTQTVIPNTQLLIDHFRAHNQDVIWARIACLLPDGRDRSLSQARPGFNNLLLPKDSDASQIAPQLRVLDDEIVVTKTTDSVLTGTNLRLVLHNMGVKNVVVAGIFTDQCVSSSVRSLADESFNVVVVEDACAAATDELHRHELTIINNIYCQVVRTDELLELLK